MNKIFSRGKRLFTDPQSGVLSAATIIMLMIVASRVLGLVRQRTLAHFFTPDELSLFFAAFRLPDTVFEVLVFGTFSSAFIPVFTKSLKEGTGKAWQIAGTVVNIGLILFVIFALIIGFGADFLYSIFAPGYTVVERAKIVNLARILFAAQGFFVISYVLTGVLESLRRFLVPALAPLFYNLGIILGTIILFPRFGLTAPVIGVFVGALSHFLIQLPLAHKLGFRFRLGVKISEDVKKIGKLALPRVVEVSFLQVSKIAELFFASLITTASYTYYTFGNSLQLLPIGLFGTSIAKAALPTLTRQSEEPEKFTKTLLSALYELVFLSLPLSTILIVLRIPIIRLVYGTDIFGWEATVQTGYVLSAFGIGIVFSASVALLARSFYALHDTKTPVMVAIYTLLLTIFMDFIFIRVLDFDVWGLATGFSIGVIVQASILLYLINRRMLRKSWFSLLKPIIKLIFASALSGIVMYVLLKIFDRSVWVKKLSFLGKIDQVRGIQFEKFVLDTRYTFNLIILTIFVTAVGGITYLLVAMILRSEEVSVFFNLVKRLFSKQKFAAIPQKETEPVAPTPTDSSN